MLIRGVPGLGLITLISISSACTAHPSCTQTPSEKCLFAALRAKTAHSRFYFFSWAKSKAKKAPLSEQAGTSTAHGGKQET